jgi:hypothetical protein
LAGLDFDKRFHISFGLVIVFTSFCFMAVSDPRTALTFQEGVFLAGTCAYVFFKSRSKRVAVDGVNDVLTGSHFSGRLSIEHFSPVRFRRKEDSDVTASKS